MSVKPIEVYTIASAATNKPCDDLLDTVKGALRELREAALIVYCDSGVEVRRKVDATNVESFLVFSGGRQGARAAAFQSGRGAVRMGAGRWLAGPFSPGRSGC